MRFVTAAVTIAAATSALFATSLAEASPINNPCTNVALPCQFRFDLNSSVPFLDFQSGESAMQLWPTQSYFRANVNGSGTMTFHDSANMQWVRTSTTQNISVKLKITNVVGTTDLSSYSHATWTITTTAAFKDPTAGYDDTNCETDEFDIDVDGDWDNVVSDTFVIPALPTGIGYCNSHASALNSIFGLGNDGATLTLYKFSGWNGSNLLVGS